MLELDLGEEPLKVPPLELATVTTSGMQVNKLFEQHEIFLAPAPPSYGHLVDMRPSETGAYSGEMDLTISEETQKLPEG